MRLLQAHYKYYRAKKFNVESQLLKAFTPSEKHNIHYLINAHSDYDSMIRHIRNQPVDGNHYKHNVYNLLKSLNKRSKSKQELIKNLEKLSYHRPEQKYIIVRLLKRLNKNP